MKGIFFNVQAFLVGIIQDAGVCLKVTLRMNQNWPMNVTQRSLLIALIAAVFVGLFTQSPRLFPGVDLVPQVLPIVVFGLSSWGLVLGIRSLKQTGSFLSWLAVALNGAILIGFFLLVILLLEALHNFN